MLKLSYQIYGYPQHWFTAYFKRMVDLISYIKNRKRMEENYHVEYEG
jgi:hypothetical protein